MALTTLDPRTALVVIDLQGTSAEVLELLAKTHGES
jgi:DNA-binding MurR/RpiR family transcriptional regulator